MSVQALNTMDLPVDVNAASADELRDRVAGIGQALAERIVEYREEHGPFMRLSDLALVPGIGDRLAEKLGTQLDFGRATKIGWPVNLIQALEPAADKIDPPSPEPDRRDFDDIPPILSGFNTLPPASSGNVWPLRWKDAAGVSSPTPPIGLSGGVESLSMVSVAAPDSGGFEQQFTARPAPIATENAQPSLSPSEPSAHVDEEVRGEAAIKASESAYSIPAPASDLPLRSKPWPLIATFLSGVAVAGVTVLLWMTGQKLATDRTTDHLSQGLEAVRSDQKAADTRIERLSDKTTKLEEQTHARFDKVEDDVDKQRRKTDEAQAGIVKMARELLSIREGVLRAQKRLDKRVDQIEEGIIEAQVSGMPGRHKPAVGATPPAASVVLGR